MEAKQLLKVRDLTLSEVAIAAGFAHQSHFMPVFSELFGASRGASRREKLGVADNEP